MSSDILKCGWYEREMGHQKKKKMVKRDQGSVFTKWNVYGEMHMGIFLNVLVVGDGKQSTT